MAAQVTKVAAFLAAYRQAYVAGKAWVCDECRQFWDRDEPIPSASFENEWKCPECGGRVSEMQPDNWPGWQGWEGRAGWVFEELFAPWHDPDDKRPDAIRIYRKDETPPPANWAPCAKCGRWDVVSDMDGGMEGHELWCFDCNAAYVEAQAHAEDES